MDVQGRVLVVTGFGALWLSVGAAGPTSAQDATAQAIAAAEAADLDSQSIGHTEAGRLEHAFAVEPRDDLAVVRPNRFGTRELVGLLYRASDAVARASPGSRLAVGDLSSEHGGPLAPHESHQTGRDADVSFFVLDPDGQPIPQGLFVEIGDAGTGRRGDTTVRFDDARNWALLVAFVDDPMAEVQHVLIAGHLRQRLLDYGRVIGAAEDAIHRVELVTAPIRGSERHDNHFHVRIYCSVGDRPECLDRPPLHPWYDGTPSPRAVEAARAADAQRAVALRRQQELERQADASLRDAQTRERARDVQRSVELEREPARQALLERARATLLTQQERRAILETRRAEAELRRQQAHMVADENGRARAVIAAERRWIEAERRRAAGLRAAAQRRDADERRRAAAARAAERRDAALVRRSAAQVAATDRRAAQLLRRSEQLARARYAARRGRPPADEPGAP